MNKIKNFLTFVTPSLAMGAAIIVALPFFLLLNGCHHKSELKHEKGIVIAKQYEPDTNQNVIGTGLSSSGDFVVTNHHIGHNEMYVVIFKCDHGVVFSVNRSDLFGNLNVNDVVRIDYYEILNSENEVIDLDFASATKD